MRAGSPVVVVTEGLPPHAGIPRLARDGVDTILAAAARVLGTAAIAPQRAALLDSLSRRG